MKRITKPNAPSLRNYFVLKLMRFRKLDEFRIGDRRFEVNEAINLLTREKYFRGIYSKGRTHSQIALNSDEPRYAQVFVELARVLSLPQAGSVLVLGVCGGSIPYDYLRRWPNLQITGIEYEEVMIEMAKKHFIPDFPPGHFNLIHADGVQYVQNPELRNQFDLVVSDIFYNTGLPNDVYTPQYFENLANITNENGVTIFNLCGAAPERTSGYLDGIKAAYGMCEVLTGDSVNLVAVAGKDAERIRENLRGFSLPNWRWLMSY